MLQFWIFIQKFGTMLIANCFTPLYMWIIREEIQRIKANNPDISHREAFSTAAKNVSFSQLTLYERIVCFEC